MKSMLTVLLTVFTLSLFSSNSYAAPDTSWRDEWRAAWREWRQENFPRKEWRSKEREERREIRREHRQEWKSNAKAVPEIDGANGILALSLTMGLVALMREKGNKR